ncbi:hypothetical protein ACFE04_004121 [Oxalis oulophora]
MVIWVWMVIILSWSASTSDAIECTTVTSLVSACSTFITYGTPDPTPGSPCCDSMLGLNLIAESTDSRRVVCNCLMAIIATYNLHSSAIGTLPGFCGINLGFTILPTTNCNEYLLSLYS